MKIIDKISYNNAKERMIREKLESHAFSDKYKGKPLKIRQVNFTVPLEKQILSYVGVPEYVKRAKVVEEKIIKIKLDLKRQYDSLGETSGNNLDSFNNAWDSILKSYDFQEINELIEKHNLLYPQEANLRMDTNSGEYLLGSKVWKQTPVFSISFIVEELPFK